MVDEVSEKNLLDSTVYLSEHFETRCSTSDGAKEAQNFLKQQFESLGLVTSTEPFRSGYSDNVIADYVGEERDKVVIIGAHYDDRAAYVVFVVLFFLLRDWRPKHNF